MRTPFTAALLVLLASACATSGVPESSEVRVPASWSVPALPADPTAAQTSFWESFGSEELARMLEQAQASNLDLRAALHRVEQARAQTRMTRASLFPALSASGGAKRDVEDSGDASRWSSLASLSYELDLFGRNRSEAESARRLEEASGYDREALRLVVTTDAASLYAQLLAFNDRIRIAQGNLANAEGLLRIIEARRLHGAASGLEVSQQRVAVNGIRASVASLVEQRATVRNALAILLGQAPQDLTLPSASLASLQVPAVDLTPPAQLVAETRPDLRAAEAQLRAADADIRAARAAFFPTFQLGTDASLAAAGFGDPASAALSLASSALAPIFSGGRLQGSLESATARQRELAAQYRKAVLGAFQEVEDALAAVTRSSEQATLARDSMEQAQAAYRIADARFRAGSIDYATLLETQRSLAQAEDGDVTAKLSRVESVLQLHRALGG
jgi:NodT family efflux transporter outer membrane factor (OMF) lipoprotein